MPIVTDYTALLSGSYWNGIEVTGRPVIVTYSFPTSASGYMASIDGFTAATVASFQPFNSTEQAEARTALGEWAAASGLVFVEVAPAQGDINFQLVDLDSTSGPSYAGAGGIGFYPFGNWNFFTYPDFSSDLDAAGDVFMNTQLVSGGAVDYGTLLHEIGHAIGLKHPTEVVTDFAANPDVTHDEVLASDDPSLTIMAETGGPPPAHLKTLDQQAAAFLYGPAGSGQVVTGNASGANAVVSSWSWKASKQRLTETGFAGDDTLRGTSVTDVINGLDGNDRLFGLDGNDTLNGGAGNDLLNGGPGVDKMTGGAGDDTYMVDTSRDEVVELAGEGFELGGGQLELYAARQCRAPAAARRRFGRTRQRAGQHAVRRRQLGQQSLRSRRRRLHGRRQRQRHARRRHRDRYDVRRRRRRHLPGRQCQRRRARGQHGRGRRWRYRYGESLHQRHAGRIR